MAKASDWQLYWQLRNLITAAVEEANDNTPEDERDEKINLAISPDFRECYATYGPWWSDDRFREADEKGWFLELADAFTPEDTANLYFDPR